MVATVASLNPAANANTECPLSLVRETVRDLLLSSAAYHSLDPEKRQEIARAMVNVCQTAVSLLAEEAQTSGTVAELSEPLAVKETPTPQQPLALAQNAGDE